MSTRKIATALGTAVLLLGTPASYALAGQDGHGKPDNPGGVHQCEDGVDNDGAEDGVDYREDGTGDPDCGSPRDNSEGSEAEEPGGGTPGLPELPPELQGVLDEVLGQLPSGPPGGGEPGVPAEVQEAVDQVTGQLPSGPPSGGEPGVPAEVQDAVDQVTGQLPSEAPAVPDEVQALLDQLPKP